MGKLNEAFSSRKLADMAKQHGGIEISINGGMRNGANAFHGGSSVDVSKITDEMLSGEPFKYDYKNTPDKVAANLIHFKDGYAVSLKPYDLKSDNNINPERPRQKPSRYGTGIGDTGDHNKKESPFFKNGKKDVGPEYNGFGVSSRAGESQHYREAIKNNKNDIKYYEEHPDGEYSKNAINRAKKNIETIKGYGKDLLNKKKNENKNMKQTIKLNESELKKIVAESVKRVVNEIGDTLAGQYMLGRLGGKKISNNDIKGFQKVADYAKNGREEIYGEENDDVILPDNDMAQEYMNGFSDYRELSDPEMEIDGKIGNFGSPEYEKKHAKKHLSDIQQDYSMEESIKRAVKSVLKESFIGGDNQFDDNVAQKAQCPSDVFRMNYWTGRTESNGNGELILRCYTDNNSMATRNYPDFEKVVNDLNQYYKLHGSKSIAQALPDDGVSRGRLLKITKKSID